MLTATTILVRGVSAASSCEASMFSVWSSTSTNRSRSPYCCSGMVGRRPGNRRHDHFVAALQRTVALVEQRRHGNEVGRRSRVDHHGMLHAERCARTLLRSAAPPRPSCSDRTGRRAGWPRAPRRPRLCWRGRRTSASTRLRAAAAMRARCRDSRTAPACSRLVSEYRAAPRARPAL